MADQRLVLAWYCLLMTALKVNTALKGVIYIICICMLFILQSLLDEPNPNSPANSLAAQLYQENKREYEKKVIAIVEQSWQST